MKQDKFLIGILVGILLLVVVAITAVLLRAPANETYVDDSTPEGVVHNYFLALQREEYEKAYLYLSDDLKDKPDLDDFIRTMSSGVRNDEVTVQIGEVRQQSDARTLVDVSITRYSAGGLFERNSYTTDETALLKLGADGQSWRLLDFPYPYWAYHWNENR